MKELRCIVFNEQEVASAIVDRKRRRREPLPSGQILGVTYQAGSALTVILHSQGEDGERDTRSVGDEEAMAAVIAYCMNKKIPLPVESDKFLYLVNGNLTLMITMNFNRQPRMVFGKSEDSDPAMTNTLRPRRVPR